MKSPLLWEHAYQQIAPNKGAMTPGVDGKTPDGFSPEMVRSIIDRLADGSYRPKPVRRVYIPKPTARNGRLACRPRRTSSSRKWCGRSLSKSKNRRLQHSHGFRKERSWPYGVGIHPRQMDGVKWLIDVDVVGFFDNIDHDVLIGLLEKWIADRRFVRLIRGLLKAGYIEDWVYHRTLQRHTSGRCRLADVGEYLPP